MSGTVTRSVAGQRSKQFGQEFRTLRRASDIKQVDVAEFMQGHGYPGISRVTVSDMENGRRRIDLDEAYWLLECIREVCGVRREGTS